MAVRRVLLVVALLNISSILVPVVVVVQVLRVRHRHLGSLRIGLLVLEQGVQLFLDVGVHPIRSLFLGRTLSRQGWHFLGIPLFTHTRFDLRLELERLPSLFDMVVGSGVDASHLQEVLVELKLGLINSPGERILLFFPGVEEFVGISCTGSGDWGFPPGVLLELIPGDPFHWVLLQEPLS